MRILMREPPARDQHAGLDERLDHCLVGVALPALFSKHALAGEAGRLLGEAAVGVDRVGDGGVDAAPGERASIRGPDVEVFPSVPGRSVDESRAGIFGDVLAGKERHLEIVALVEILKRMLAHQSGQIARRNAFELLESGHPGLTEYLDRELVRQHETVARLRPIVARGVDDLV